ncbi:MAG: LysM peptidoglycan-binding domain-containing protein [Chloroflexota bacterium]
MRHRRAAAGLILCIISILFTANLSLAQSPQTTEEPAAPVKIEPVTASPESLVQPAVQPLATSAPTTGETLYTVKPGENLFRIALRFGLSTRQLAAYNGIVNPGVIYAGQQLKIPGGVVPTATPVVPPPATAVPPPTTTYTVTRGDTLFKIAVRFKTTVAQLVTLNNLRNPNFIYTGQVLNIPTNTSTTLPAVVPTATVSAPLVQDATAVVEPGGGLVAAPAPTGYGFGYGIEAYMVDQDVPTLTDQVASLGVSWVKQEILWKDFEPVKGEIDFDTIDAIVNSLHDKNLNILLTISAAPSWARSSTDENGPPDNFADYATFVGSLATRYVGKVQAYEIWNEPNLRREWNSTVHAINPAVYMDLLRAAYGAIKAADPSAVVVSGGLAPTGFNDGVNAISDRVFLDSLYANGLAEVSDAIGAHPLGWANPPDSMCCDAPVGVLTHYQDPSFYFLNTLNLYRGIMVDHGDSSTAIWATKFGWGTSEDTDPPSENYVFVSYTTLGEQAIYDLRGFELGSQLGFVGPMFLDNLNGCLVQLGSLEPCYYSLVASDGAPRPVFAAMQAAVESKSTGAPVVITTPSVESTGEIPAPTLEAPTAESLPILPTDAPIEPAATVDMTG